MKLQRYEGNPILSPLGDDWESVAVFNPSASLTGGAIHLLYRAVGEYYPYASKLGHAVFNENLNLLKRHSEPILIPHWKMWEQSVEDPRTTDINGELLLTYVATPTPSPPGAVRRRLGIPKPRRSAYPRTALARINNFREFERFGVISPFGADERDVVLFPEKIGGRYAVLHRPANWIGSDHGTSCPSIWFASMGDLTQKMEQHRLVLKPETEWEENKVGAGPPPLKTEEGWLLIYHGVDRNNVYRAGAALLDLEKPWKVRARTPEPILEPEEEYEKTGDVPNVVFPEGMVKTGRSLIVFYGSADKVCCAALANLEDFISDLLAERKD